MARTGFPTMRIALCQIGTSTDLIDDNVAGIERCLETEADMYVFPEMFLTGYFSKEKDDGALRSALDRLLAIASERRICIVAGGPEYTANGTYDSAYVISDSVRTYRKIHLPNFPPFTEKERFIPGSAPFTFDFNGIRFGLCICYDVFFPELLKSCTVDGSTVNIVISASPVSSRPAFERVLPARALENTSYLVFVNNIGTYDGMEFFAGSRVLNPDGSTLKTSEEEGVIVFDYDPEAVEDARRKRPVIADTVSEIKWK